MIDTIKTVDADTEDYVTIDKDTPIRVFRDPDRDDEVVVKKEDTIIPLGVRDITVSREYDNENSPGYVELFISDEQLFARDTGSKSQVIKRDSSDSKELPTDEKVRIDCDCIMKLGHESEIRVSVMNGD